MGAQLPAGKFMSTNKTKVSVNLISMETNRNDLMIDLFLLLLQILMIEAD